MSKNFIIILKGVSLAIILTFVLVFIFSVLLTYTSIPEIWIFPDILLITVISIFVSSSISNMKIKSKGLLNGGLIGLIYILLMYLISGLVDMNFIITGKSLIIFACSFVFGILGGIVGVNLK